MLIAEDKSKTLKVRAEAGKDARLYAAVPYRAWRDERLKTPELKVLIAICGFLTGGQVVKASQPWIADQLGVSIQYINRFVKRLEHFGYLVLLEKKIVGVLPTIYGVVFDEKNPPTRDDVKYLKQDIEQLPKKEADYSYINQPITKAGVDISLLVIGWRKLVGDAYSSSEGLEDRHWAELSRGGMTCDMLAALHLRPGRTLIGYYMAEARRMLGVVS